MPTPKLGQGEGTDLDREYGSPLQGWLQLLRRCQEKILAFLDKHMK